MPTPYSAVVPHYVRCFTEYLRAQGYYCTNNRKCDYQFDPPVTAWDENGEHAHWRNRPDPETPFFAVFNPTRTHESGMWRENCPEPSFDPADMQLPPYFPDTPEVRLSMARMYTHIEESDRELGRLLGQLEEDGLADNTFVFHWSDHGPLPRGKRWPYDSGIHVPMIVSGPGIKAGSVSQDLVSTIDLGPSVLSIAGVDIPRHIQGNAFLGPRAGEPRRYVYASRDRYDESYDMVRAVRDVRFKYIRNCRPELPYLLWIPYRNRHPIMQELWRLHLSGELDEVQSAMFCCHRPPEELYDTENDPHETMNLAGDPQYARELLRLREALDDWRDSVGDMGVISESEMVNAWYPSGIQPSTAAPVFVPISKESPGIEPVTDGSVHALTAPALIQIHCATQGASIAYTFEGDQNPHWKLYTGPITLEPGKNRLRAKAVRIGYLESKESSAIFACRKYDSGEGY